MVWKNTVPTTSPKNPYNTWGVGKHGFASSSVAIDKTGIYVFYVSREKGIYVVAAKPQFELLSHTTIAGDDSIFNASPVPLPGGAVLLRSDKFLYRIRPAN